MTRKDVAKMLNISLRGVDRLRAAKILLAHKFGNCVRFDEQRVAAYQCDSLDAVETPKPPKIKRLVIRDRLAEIIAAESSRPHRGARRNG